MVRPIVDSRGNVISGQQVAERTNIIGARNFRGGLPDADANLSFVPMDRRGVAGLQGGDEVEEIALGAHRTASRSA